MVAGMPPSSRAGILGAMTTQSIAAPPSGLAWQLARLTSPFTRAMAGRRFFPLWAVVRHEGRRSGRRYATPVAVRVSDDAFVIALPWGPGTQWARNVLAAGGCVVRWRGVDHRTTSPAIIGREEASASFTRIQRGVLSAAGVHHYLRLARHPG
jgi:deazaflavin-dependent oxidoreductase (nitroreductase family)